MYELLLKKIKDAYVLAIVAMEAMYAYLARRRAPAERGLGIVASLIYMSDL